MEKNVKEIDKYRNEIHKYNVIFLLSIERNKESIQ